MSNAERIAKSVERAAGKGLDAARLFLVARVKETLNVPAPRKRVVSHAGRMYYRAATPATPDAPPRKVSGAMQRSATSRMTGPRSAVVVVSAKSPEGFSYPRYHEVKTAGQAGSGKHRYIAPTVEKYRRELKAIVGQEIEACQHP